MSLEFVFVVFCLTIIALVSISHNKDYLAEEAINALSSLAEQLVISTSGIKRLLKRKSNKTA